MSQPTLAPIRCPRCGHKLMEAEWLAKRVRVRIKCPSRECRDAVVQIREDLTAEMIPHEKMTP